MKRRKEIMVLKRRISRFLAVAVLLSAAACRREEEPGHRPLARNDGWAIANPQAQGLDPARIDTAYDEAGGLDNICSELNLVVVATAAPQPGFDDDSWRHEKAVLELVGRLIASL